MKYLFILGLLAVAGCSTCPITKVPTPVACEDKRLPPPIYPDSKEAVNSIPQGDIVDLEKLVMKGRLMRDERLAEDDAQIQACAQVK